MDRTPVAWIKAGLAIGFLVGASVHGVWIAQHGWLNHPDGALWKQVFWDGLLFLDTAAAILLVVRVRWGLVLGLAIMAADLAINWTTFPFAKAPLQLTLQTAFALILAASAGRLWRSGAARPDRS